MKKLLLFTIFIVFISCSEDETEIVESSTPEKEKLQYGVEINYPLKKLTDRIQQIHQIKIG